MGYITVVPHSMDYIDLYYFDLIGFRGLMLHHSPRSTSPYLRPLKNKGFKEERVTTIGLYDIGTSTTLESNKSQGCLDTTAKKAAWNSSRPPRFPEANLNIYS